MNFLVYKISFPNSKFYIGVTTKPIEERILGHKKAARFKSSLVGRAIGKFGEHNIKTEVLFCCSSKEEMLRREKESIILFNSKHPFGYNLTDGGDGITGNKIS